MERDLSVVERVRRLLLAGDIALAMEESGRLATEFRDRERKVSGVRREIEEKQWQISHDEETNKKLRVWLEQIHGMMGGNVPALPFD